MELNPIQFDLILLLKVNHLFDLFVMVRNISLVIAVTISLTLTLRLIVVVALLLLSWLWLLCVSLSVRWCLLTLAKVIGISLSVGISSADPTGLW